MHSELLKKRILLCFLEDESSTVTKISRTLLETKQNISRIMILLEKEGLLNRDNPRKPYLTQKGKEDILQFQVRVNINMRHLMYEGVSIEDAKNDAMFFALCASNQTMEMIKSIEKRYRMKEQFHENQRFNGKDLCKYLEDGIYHFPFLIYKENAQDGHMLSMANEGFIHPCKVVIKNNNGYIQLQSISVTQHSFHHETTKAIVKTFKYLDAGDYILAETIGNSITFPLEAIQFITIGTGIERILHGTVNLKMNSTASSMPESTAIFTILI